MKARFPGIVPLTMDVIRKLYEDVFVERAVLSLFSGKILLNELAVRTSSEVLTDRAFSVGRGTQ